MPVLIELICQWDRQTDRQIIYHSSKCYQGNKAKEWQRILALIRLSGRDFLKRWHVSRDLTVKKEYTCGFLGEECPQIEETGKFMWLEPGWLQQRWKWFWTCRKWPSHGWGLETMERALDFYSEYDEKVLELFDKMCSSVLSFILNHSRCWVENWRLGCKAVKRSTRYKANTIF